jgi:hypothetical protein
MVQPFIARYESELQVPQLLMRAIIRTKVICSRLFDPASLTVLTNSCQAVPRRSRNAGKMRRGKIRSVSGLYMPETQFCLIGGGAGGLLGCAGGILHRRVSWSDTLIIFAGFREPGFIIDIAPK